MGSFYAELHVAGHAFPVRRADFSVHQDTDHRGRVVGQVRHGPLHVTLDVPREVAVLEAWAAAPYKPLPGQLVFYDATAQIPQETIGFAAGHCTHYGEEFDAGRTGGPAAYVCHLTITGEVFELLPGGVSARAFPAAAAAVSQAVKAPAGPPPPPTGAELARAVAADAAGPPPEYTLAEFTATVWGADQVAPAVLSQLYAHFNNAKAAADPAPHWAAMQALIRATTYTNAKGETLVLNGGWPPAFGGFNKRLVQPAPPDRFDRYQKEVAVSPDGLPVLAGTFTSPIPPDGAFDYEARALEGKEEDYELMYTIEVLKPLPFAGEEADITPWHGHEGNGVQTRMLFPPRDPVTGKFPWNWGNLEKEGYVRITYKSSPNGKFLVSPDGKTATARTV